MKISIKNFKSIGNLIDFKIEPLTILSGNNSSGKSSFIQLLLLLKQTIEIDSAKYPLYINGKYYKAKNIIDLVKDKNHLKEIEITFLIKKEEFSFYKSSIQKSLFDSFPDYECSFRVRYGLNENEIGIREIEVSYLTEIKKEYIVITHDFKNGNIHIDTNNNYFLKFEYEDNENLDVVRRVSNVSYTSFFPKSIEESINLINEDYLDEKGNPTFTLLQSFIRPNIDSVKSFFEAYFKGLYYIGPLRNEPQDSYIGNLEAGWVGIKGENTAQILENKKTNIIEFNNPIITDDSIEFHRIKITLIEAVNIWMCQVFKFGKRLYAKEVGESYIVMFENESGVETTIKHVGFGISQILPVIVQGLLMNEGETLILEQPEIHLHPKVQSFLFDFLYSLILQNKKIIVETHSDHLITRLRRRIAEDPFSNLNLMVNLSFIEQEKNDLVFKRVNINELGIYQIFPEDFIESPEKELKALISAQMKKRKLKR